MNKCLVTKLHGVVNNSSLLRIGELPIHVRKSSEAQASQYKLNVLISKDSNVEIIGDGYFTDETMTANKGKKVSIPANIRTTLYFSNGDYDAIISNKYDIVTFSLTEDGSTRENFISIDLNDLSFSDKLKDVVLTKSKSNGTVESLQGKNVEKIYLNNTEVVGNAKSINVGSLTALCINSENISYDISNLAGTTNLTNVNFSNTGLQTGNLSNLAGNTRLKYFGVIGKGLNGDLSVFNNFTQLAQTALQNYSLNITGDIGKLPDIIIFFANSTDVEFTYSKGSRTAILGCSNIKLSNIDTFLNDMASLSASTGNVYKTISLIGTRTSASDAAVQTLQSKGYTVSITPA